jgi:hypothetical protein
MNFSIISIFLFCLLTAESVFASQATDIALEMKSIKVEYIETSKRGIIYVNDCDHCKEPYYQFSTLPEITRKGKAISFDEFLTDYWNATFPTLILDSKTHSVLHVIY